MYKLITLFFLQIVLISLCNGQKCLRIRNSNNLEIPFATFVNSDNSYGKYADEKGNICLNINLLSDTIFISSVGYKRLMILRKEYLEKEILLLEPFSQNLREIIVKPNKIKRTSFSNYSKSAISIYKHLWNPNSNLLVTGYIENTSEQAQLIEKVKFFLSPKKSHIVDKFKVRLRFFDNKDNKPNQEITQTNIITELKPSDKNLDLTLNNQNLYMPENGIWIGMEIVGYYNFESVFIPLENGKTGKASFRNNGKIKNIELISPSYDLVKMKDGSNCYTKDFLDKWRKGIRTTDPDYYYSPKIEIIAIQN